MQYVDIYHGVCSMPSADFLSSASVITAYLSFSLYRFIQMLTLAADFRRYLVWVINLHKKPAQNKQDYLWNHTSQREASSTSQSHSILTNTYTNAHTRTTKSSPLRFFPPFTIIALPFLSYPSFSLLTLHRSYSFLIENYWLYHWRKVPYKPANAGGGHSFRWFRI